MAEGGGRLFSVDSNRLDRVQGRAGLPVGHSAVPGPTQITARRGGGRGRRQVASRDGHVVTVLGTLSVHRRYTGRKVRASHEH